MRSAVQTALSPPLVREEAWQWDGVTVLTAHLTLPQLAGTGRKVLRFNRFYRRLGDAFLSRCERVLLPRAADSCRAAMARSAPWQRTEAALSFLVTRQDEDALSLCFDVCENGAHTARFCAVWDTKTLLPTPRAEWVGDDRFFTLPADTPLPRSAGKNAAFLLAEKSGALTPPWA